MPCEAKRCIIRPGRVRVDTARIGKDSHGDRLVADLIGDAEIGH